VAETNDGAAPEAYGARVLETGLAVVHAGELILPAGGSEAQAEQVLADEQTAVAYVFPVEVEVRGSPDVDHDSIVERTLSSLASSVRSLA
jgi:hypothetical protein